MDIRYRLYPYPVLAYYSDDYEGSSFDVAIAPKHDGYNLRIDFSAKLYNEELQGYLKSDDIKIVYHLECPQTGYRTVLQTHSAELTHIIPNKNVSGRLQICPFIVAMKDIPAYVNQSFHEDYRGFKFQIESGCILAVGKQVNVDVDKDINDLANTRSVFSIIKNADQTAVGMVVDMDKKKIVIKLPEEDYYNFKSIKNETYIQPVLNSLVVVPALLYVLEELGRREPDERNEYSIYNWYRAIKKALAGKMNCDIESDQLSALNMLEVAQKLINTPLSEGLHVLSSDFGNDDEEDE